MNAYELFDGAWGSDSHEKNVRAVARFLNGVSMLEFDMEASLRAGKINAGLMKKGASIGVEDALVAGIVTRHRETLATRNVRHFERVPGLRIIVW